jgi:hypothetical protein
MAALVGVCTALAGCRESATEVEVVVVNGPAAPAPEHLLFSWLLCEDQFVFRDRRVPEAGSLVMGADPVATVLVRLELPAAAGRRVLVKGADPAGTISTGSAALLIEPGQRARVQVRLAPGEPPDTDGDGVPDDMAPCQPPPPDAAPPAGPAPDASASDGPAPDAWTSVMDAWSGDRRSDSGPWPPVDSAVPPADAEVPPKIRDAGGSLADRPPADADRSPADAAPEPRDVASDRAPPPVDTGRDEPPPTLEEGLVGWWRFDEGNGTLAGDSSGRGNHARLGGGADFGPGRSGRSGLDLRGDGNLARVEDPADGSLDFDAGTFTVSAWFRTRQLGPLLPDPGAPIPQILSKAEEGPAGGRVGYELRILLGGVGFYVWTGNPAPTDTLEIGTSDGRWHHVVGRKGRTAITLFVDGVPVRQVPAPPGSSSNTAALVFGAGLFGGDFDGQIDEVRIYDRALSDAEAVALFRSQGP